MRCVAALSLLLAACSDARSPAGGMPSAQLSVPAQVALGARVLVDASGSRDPEGKLLRFRFDFNDGSPSVVTGEASTHHAFRLRGLFPVCVWVTDLDGLTASECREVTVVLAPDASIKDAALDADGPGPADAARERSDAATLDATPDKAKPDLAKLDATPDKTKPDVAKLDATPDKAKPDLAKLDTAPDKAKPDLAKQDAKPDLAKPDLAKPDANTCFTPEVGGSGAAGYTLKLVPACHPTLSSSNKLGVNKDEAGVLTILPFTFSFFGKSAVAAGVSANGYLQLVGANPLALLEPIPVPIPSSSVPNNLIAAFWDNLAPKSAGSDVWVATVGQAPKRVYLIQWQSWTFSGAAAPAELSFTILLYEGSNVIELQYSQLDGGARATGGEAAIGIEDLNGASGVQHAYKKAGAVSTGQGIRFVPN